MMHNMVAVVGLGNLSKNQTKLDSLFRHRRIVVCLRLDTLALTYSLLWAVSADKNDTLSFLSRLPNELRSSVYNLKPRRKPRLRKQKKNRHPMGVCLFLVAEVGFEPHDLRVMSPTSYQAALLRDIAFL